VRSGDSFKRYLELGSALAQSGKARVEELVTELVQGTEDQRSDTKAKVADLVDRGRQSSEALVATIRAEVTQQLDTRGIATVEDLAEHLAVLLRRSPRNPPSPAHPAPSDAGVAPAQKAQAATKKAPVQKAPAKKSAAKKAPAKKAPAKKSAAKKAPAKKSAATTAAVSPPEGSGSPTPTSGPPA
jgi:polyhydroxyalkanoate synthesis regulator phasin